MAKVIIQTGAVSATDAPYDVPVEKWYHLILERQSYIQVKLPYDCEKLLQFVHEAEQYEMWQKVEHVDSATGNRRPYESLDDFIRNAFQLDPKQVEWAKEGWKMLKPNEPVPFAKVVELGKKSAEGKRMLQEEPDLKPKDLEVRLGISDRWARSIVAGSKAEVNKEPKLLKHGGKRDEQVGDNQVASSNGMTRDYIIARLERDGQHDLAAQVRSGVKSARKAAMEAGFKVPESQLTILKRAWRKASESDRESFKLFIEVK